MTYPLFLLVYLVIPIVLLGYFLRHAWRRTWWYRSVVFAIAAALIYTTPWDNYLVATRVWFYDPQRVWGIILGWVPLEEYLFFALQTILTGMLVAGLVRWETQRKSQNKN